MLKQVRQFQKYGTWVKSCESHEAEISDTEKEVVISVSPETGLDESDTASVKAELNTDIDITLEDYTRVSDMENGKTIDGYHFDEISGTYKRYVVSGFDASSNPSAEDNDNLIELVILLQNGLVGTSGMNGVTVEDLLVVCKNIMEGYQSTKFNCPENEEALSGINKALTALRSRLQRREASGTLNTHKAD